MKKIYFLSLLCFLGFLAKAQTTVVLTPTGGAGTYTTASCNGTVRTDDNISSNDFTGSKGYCVFDLTGIPAGSKIMSCDIGFYLNAISSSSSASNCQIYGYPGDLSTVTTPATLYSDIFPGSGLPIVSPASFGSSVGTQKILSVSGVTTFIEAHIGSKVSICWSGGGIVSYGITGETGGSPLPVTSPPANHKPYLNIIYCTQPSITASASPNPVCENFTLSLSQVTSNANSISGPTYSWTGPSSYSSPLANPTLTAALTSAGVYSVTVSNTCSVPLPAVTLKANAVTFSVTVNPTPKAITGTSVICQSTSGGPYNTTTLSDASIITPPAPGVWSSSNTLVLTVSNGYPGGTVNATTTTTGTANVSYTFPSGCYAVFPMKVNARPATITGFTDQVCPLNTIPLTETSSGGAWTSSNTFIATVLGGTVKGVTAGSASIDYTIPGCPAATYAVTVNPTPDPIVGGTNTCLGSAVKFSDALTGGVWSTSNTEAAFGVPPSGPDELTGIIPGTATITYTSFHGCSITLLVNVDPPLSPIGLAPGNIAVICENGPTTMLSDATSGGFWSTGSTTALVDPGGNVSGIGGGTASITYNEGACKVFYTVTVNPAPLPITGRSVVCQYDSFYLADPTTGDKWSSANTLTATIDSVTGFVHALQKNIAGLDFMYTDRGSSCASKFRVVINPTPDATISTDGPTTFCTGLGVRISVPADPSATYQWSSNGTPISGATTNAYAVSTTQTITLKINNVYGCVANSVPVLVISGISPTISVKGTDTFCQGGNAILTADAHGSVGMISYQWTRNGANITGANTSTYYATTSGIYDCIVSVAGYSGTCKVTTSDDTLFVHPAPIPSISYASRQLHTDAGYKGYQWYLNTMAVPGAAKSAYTPKENGSYRVLVTDANGCTGYSTPIVVTTAGVGRIEQGDIKIYPNPASAIVRIESPAPVDAVVTSMEGRTVISGKNVKQLDITALSKGVYIIMLFDENGERVAVQKLIKD